MRTAKTTCPTAAVPTGVIGPTPAARPDLITRAAYHEAGHAVVAFTAGFRVDRLWIEAGDGRCEIFIPDRGTERQRLIAELGFFVAGCAAEALRFPELDGRGRRPFLTGEGDPGGDFTKAMRLARRLCAIGTGSVEPDDEFAAMFVFQTLAGVKARLARPESWRPIVQLADLLVRHRRIEGPTAEQVWRQAGGAGNLRCGPRW